MLSGRGRRCRAGRRSPTSRSSSAPRSGRCHGGVGRVSAMSRNSLVGVGGALVHVRLDSRLANGGAALVADLLQLIDDVRAVDHGDLQPAQVFNAFDALRVVTGDDYPATSVLTDEHVELLQPVGRDRTGADDRVVTSCEQAWMIESNWTLVNSNSTPSTLPRALMRSTGDAGRRRVVLLVELVGRVTERRGHSDHAARFDRVRKPVVQ
jgi:hypothetical protein